MIEVLNIEVSCRRITMNLRPILLLPVYPFEEDSGWFKRANLQICQHDIKTYGL